MVDLPFNQLVTHAQLIPALAEGDYVVSVQIEARLSVGFRLNATYDFRVYVGDPANAPSGNEINHSELAEFDRFPAWSLGETFGEFVLNRIQHHDSSGDDFVEITYAAEDGRTDVGIVVISQGPLSEEELRAREESRQDLGESVIVNGVDGWMTRVDDNARTIDVDLAGGHLTIFATDQETALAAAGAVQQVNDP